VGLPALWWWQRAVGNTLPMRAAAIRHYGKSGDGLMRFTDPAAIAGAVFARLTTAAEGVAVRGLLGAGAASVIPVDRLEAGADDLPTRPLVALATLPARTDGGRDLHTFRWWVYDDPQQGTARIGLVLAALPGAYDPERAPLPAGVGGIQFGGASEARVDTALNLRFRFFDLVVIA